MISSAEASPLVKSFCEAERGVGEGVGVVSGISAKSPFMVFGDKTSRSSSGSSMSLSSPALALYSIFGGTRGLDFWS